MLVTGVVEIVLIAGPGIVLLYGGDRLPRRDIHPEFYPDVTRWCLGGLGVMLAILVFYSLQPGEVVDDPSTVLILTGLAGVAGFAAGVHNAHAKTRERELQKTVEQLRASNERLEQFAYAVSHDLQEPLRMVSSYLQLIDRRYADDLDEDGREFIDFAVDGADRMRAMVASLLRYSRITTQGQSLEPTDAQAVLEDVLEDLQLRIEETDATIETDDFPTVTADADQLSQVFQNLISNALKYSGNDPPRVHVDAERTGDAWRFSVRDEGIGIDPEYHDRVFDIFERLQSEEAGGEQGAGGIGLALCERIVERHGGDIWVDSEPGEGATFSFTIPAADRRDS